MIRTINPCAAAARTAEIMARYRPIAPKPEASVDNDNSALPNGIRKSPYLRNVWAQLQARPTRTRKRGRSAAFAPPPPTVKRARACLQGLVHPYQIANTPARNLAMHGFTRAAGNGQVQPPPAQISAVPSLVPLKCGMDTAVTTLSESVALPLICGGRAASPPAGTPKPALDLNATAPADQFPEELDFLAQLQQPPSPPTPIIISPKPVRPIGSTITVTTRLADAPAYETSDDAEAAVEADPGPAVVTDSSHRVRIANSAYKEMVGQPECGWLDCAGGGRSRRIGGDVSLQFKDSEPLPGTHGFHCRVKIEWESGGMKNVVHADCRGVKLTGQTKNYQFMWRFGTGEGGASASESASDN